MKNKKYENGNILPFTNSTGAEIAADTVVQMSGGFGADQINIGVVVSPIADGETGSIDTHGVFELPKKTATDEFSQGDAIKLDGATVVLHSATGSPDMIVNNAYVFADSVSGETTVLVKIG